MDLEEYHDKVMVPSLVKSITDGKMDNVIFDPDCQDIIAGNLELKNAVETRIKILSKKV